MDENAAEWERIARRLLHDELVFEASEFIRECIVPLVDDLDELRTKFELEARSEAN